MTESTESIIIINGVKTELIRADLDKDGVTGGVEKVQQKFASNNVVPVKDSTELGDAIKEQNKDIIADRLSSMDFSSRIDRLEMPPMVALDACIGLNVIPVACGRVNRVKMRKSVAIDGQGRKEFVDLVTGKKDQDMRAGFGQKLGNFIGMGGQEKEE